MLPSQSLSIPSLQLTSQVQVRAWQSGSAQSIFPSQSLSTPSKQELSASWGMPPFPEQAQLAPLHSRPFGPQVWPAQVESAQSVSRSPSSSIPLSQIDSQ